MASHRVHIGVLLAVTMGLGAAPALAAPLLETAFGYQGQLKQAGVPVDGPTDFRFSLWTAAAGPSQVGGSLSRLGVDVVDGLFAVPLDFGVAAFQGEARWLQIEARHPAGGGVHSTGGSFDLHGTAGQAASDQLQGGALTLSGGFWFGLDPADCNSDGRVDAADYTDFADCLFGPDAIAPPPLCSCLDLDVDGDDDLADFASFQVVFRK